MRKFAPPGHQLLREEAYEYLRNELKEGKLKPGMFISISRLMKSLGLSRTPLRDTLLQLQNDGFVTFLPQRDIRINKLTTQDIKDMYEMLGALDSRILLSAFDRIGPTERKAMRTLNRQMMENISERTFGRCWDLNTAFHNVYRELASNAPVLRQINIIRQRLFEFAKKDWSRKMGEMNHAEHITLMKLIGKGDPRGGGGFHSRRPLRHQLLT